MDLFSSGDRSLEAYAMEYFSDVFPDAIINTDMVPMTAEQLENLRLAGLDAAEVIQPDGAHFVATFLVTHTPYTEAIGRIHELEESGLLPHGSHEQAIDDVIAGTFARAWKHFLS